MIATYLFGQTGRVETVRLLRTARTNGSRIEASNYGTKLVSVAVPDCNGRLNNVIQ